MISLSRTQATCALSSGEAELYAIGTGINEALHIKNFLIESELATKVNITVHTDSTAGKSLATRIGTGKRSKHFDLKYLYMQDLVKQGLVRLEKVHTLQNSADSLTKYVDATTLLRHLSALGLEPST